MVTKNIRKPGGQIARRKQVVKALYEHGPLSRRGLHQIMKPPIQPRALQHVLKRLYTKGMIRKAWEWLPQNHGCIYQLSQSALFRSDICKILDIDPEAYRMRNWRNVELIHSELCALWATNFHALCPEARVIRDFRIMSDEEARSALIASYDDHEILPDILLIVPKGQDEQPLRIAVEIEKTHKANHRYSAKLRKLATETSLDGVIYLCTKQTILSKVITQYDDEVSGRKERVAQYGANFLLLGLIDPNMSDAGLKLYNAEWQPVFFNDWIHILAQNSIGLRRNHHFSPPAEARTS